MHFFLPSSRDSQLSLVHSRGVPDSFTVVVCMVFVFLHCSALSSLLPSLAWFVIYVLNKHSVFLYSPIIALVFILCSRFVTYIIVVLVSLTHSSILVFFTLPLITII